MAGLQKAKGNVELGEAREIDNVELDIYTWWQTFVAPTPQYISTLHKERPLVFLLVSRTVRKSYNPLFAILEFKKLQKPKAFCEVFDGKT